jgi:hypothetical protein
VRRHPSPGVEERDGTPGSFRQARIIAESDHPLVELANTSVKCSVQSHADVLGREARAEEVSARSRGVLDVLIPCQC